jgi:hypothetical protein
MIPVELFPIFFSLYTLVMPCGTALAAIFLAMLMNPDETATTAFVLADPENVYR